MVRFLFSFQTTLNANSKKTFVTGSSIIPESLHMLVGVAKPEKLFKHWRLTDPKPITWTVRKSILFLPPDQVQFQGMVKAKVRCSVLGLKPPYIQKSVYSFTICSWYWFKFLQISVKNSYMSNKLAYAKTLYQICYIYRALLGEKTERIVKLSFDS